MSRYLVIQDPRFRTQVRTVMGAAAGVFTAALKKRNGVQRMLIRTFAAATIATGIFGGFIFPVLLGGIMVWGGNALDRLP